MVSCIIIDNGESNVVQLTFENLYKELKDIYGSELLIRKNWFDIEGVKNRYVCYVEADCLVSPGFFTSQLEYFKRKGFSRVSGVIAPATAVNQWDNKIYGYHIPEHRSWDGFIPNRIKRSSNLFSAQTVYIPGSIIRLSMLKKVMADMAVYLDLVHMSTEVSLSFWRHGYRVNVNPVATYVTTEKYVNDICRGSSSLTNELLELFARESI